MGINVTITADSAEELRTLLSGFSAIVSEGVITGASVTASVPVEKATRTRKPVETPVATHAPDNEPADVDAEYPAEPVTLEQLRAKAAEVAQAGKQAEVKALLLQFEAKSISTVLDDQRSAFLKALEAL